MAKIKSRNCPVTDQPCYYAGCTGSPCVIKKPAPFSWKPSTGPNPSKRTEPVESKQPRKKKP